MKRTRVIPVLLIQNEGLAKGIQFKNHRYVGDPINAVKIFNEKEVDEIAIIDISATKEKRGPNFDFIKDITNEAFMPLAYGGGITQLDDIKKLIHSGVEKVIINTSLFHNATFIEEAAKLFGSQSIVACIDIKKNWLGKYQICTNNASKIISTNIEQEIKKIESMGCGEIILQSVDNDGTANGYDLTLIKKVASLVNIPVVALGGAWEILHLKEAINSGASAVAAGSMFVFHGKHKAVLITYPETETLINKLY